MNRPFRKLKAAVFTVGNVIETLFDRARAWAKIRFGMLDDLEVFPYRGHGTDREVFLKGRVLEEKGVTHSTQHDTVTNNIRNMRRRFFSSEIPYAKVRGRHAGVEIETTADEEGFFEFRFDVSGEERTNDLEWRKVEVELISPLAPGQTEVRSQGWSLVPKEECTFGIISDMDDTVVHSRATNVLKMAWIVLLNNAHTRLPFPGVAEFYRALRAGPDGERRNPLFYVSSSPWNIYDVLTDFMDVHAVPHGPIFLKDWSLSVLGAHEDHKLGIIRRLLETYPDLPFVLIGDSGEEDPEIYARAISEHPGRIRAAFIRDVTGSGRRAEVRRIAAAVEDSGCEMHLVPDSGQAAEIAARMNLIARQNARQVYENLP